MAEASFDVGLGLDGTHVLITGSSGAIGTVLVRAFLAAGAYVSAFDLVRPREPLEHERLQTHQADITDETSLERALESARERYGVITTCVLAAGVDLSYCQHHSLVDMPLKEWQRILNVNLDGTFLTCRAWLRGIQSHATPQSRNISAIVFGSEAGTFGVADCAAYAASKSAIQYGLVKSLARDAVNIHPRCRINAIAPGPVATKQFSKECDDDPITLWREAQATVALKQAVPLEAVARACLFLASENFAGNLTGQILPVDSGKSGALMWPEAPVS
ncbi:putative short chain dehydrogenase [Cladophialophora carrionii]|uniref:Putative short chain dehydrogenase n=1 Tax=Cladophialophora carrionii TaxID=86049 RepID=A0A1C1CAI7_9EURO|nr:putative short chain dehydrogenase [Cladophialophora carrionii]